MSNLVVVGVDGSSTALTAVEAAAAAAARRSAALRVVHAEVPIKPRLWCRTRLLERWSWKRRPVPFRWRLRSV
ncbi:universal stress protein [Streptomyces nigra]|uniref:Universal stress protein n=1 Tax=Streptomyces nigra TaxID=1827580 RepID=A0ABZ1J5L1_9ACTN